VNKYAELSAIPVSFSDICVIYDEELKLKRASDFCFETVSVNIHKQN
jgi:hypothetical protein